MQETMQQTLDYLYGLTRFGMKLGLETVTKLLETLNNPQNSYKTIHIAGTNGKGSTAAFIYSILKEAGYKVGLYTSPHLVKFNERIKIGDKNSENEITDKELVEYTKLLRKNSEEANNLQPTFFEFTTAMAFLHFQKQEVDFAIIETGMGGRLDATNVLKSEVSVITNVSFDHMKHLGNTKLGIAKEKAAIIKEGGLVVTAETDQSVLGLFKEVCKEKEAKLFIVDGEESSQSKINLLGEHQLRNAATSSLVSKLLEIPENKVKEGLLKATWSGRLEYIASNVLVDCAHNVAGMEYLADYVKKLPQRKILILGIAEDKEINKMVSLIVPLFETVILTQGNFKPAELDVLEKEVKKYNRNKKIIKHPKVEEAIQEALSLVSKEDLILVTGSIYLVGDILKYRNLFK